MMSNDVVWSTTSSNTSIRRGRGRGIVLYEQYRLVERNEDEISGAWKGIHLLLFFLTFVFGLFCTFCFHMLMYMFEDKCILFPKLLSLTPQRYSVVYEFIPQDKIYSLPVDFLSTQWVEDRVCYLPMFVPLVSGIFALIWITLFLMCGTGGVKSQTGLHQPWRLLFPLFFFSTAMGLLCIYTSMFTKRGLTAFCKKLGEFTNSSECSYTVNVASLAYERQIRGVYQATRLTTTAGWVHTSCWMLSAAVVLLRVVLVVDFKLVRVRVEFTGELETLLQQSERHIRSISPEGPDTEGLQETSVQTQEAPKEDVFSSVAEKSTHTTTLHYKPGNTKIKHTLGFTHIKSSTPVVHFDRLKGRKVPYLKIKSNKQLSNISKQAVTRSSKKKATKKSSMTEKRKKQTDKAVRETKSNKPQKSTLVKEIIQNELRDNETSTTQNSDSEKSYDTQSSTNTRSDTKQDSE